MFQEVSELAQISGLTGLIANFISAFFGLIVLYKAIKSKDKLVFYFYLCIVFTASPWFPSGYGYLFWLITGITLEYQVYVLIGMMFVPIAILSWLYIYLTTIRPDKKKLVLTIYSIISIIFEIYLFYFLFFAPDAPVELLLGIFDDPTNPIDIDYKGFILIYLGLSVITSTITGIHFSIMSMKIKEDPSMVWKGRLLIIGFLLFGFSSIFDAMIEMVPIVLIFVRTLLAIGNVFFYMGFILPKWTKKILSIE